MKKNIVRTVFFIILSFTVGFFAHALFFPYLFTDNLAVTSSVKAGGVDAATEQNPSLSKVVYQDGQFSPRVIQMKKSYYIIITNASDKELMWLTSDNKLLVTPRGYALGEGLRAQLYDPGTYTVSSTLHPSEKLQVIVK